MAISATAGWSLHELGLADCHDQRLTKRGVLIIFNSTQGTSTESNKSQLTINFDNSNFSTSAGFSADIKVSEGRPQI